MKSVKGAQGGYILAKSPRDITVGEVLRAMEGEILIVEEELKKNEGSLLYQNMQACLQRQVWDKITESVKKTIDEMTLEDLINDYEQLVVKDVDMYYI